MTWAASSNWSGFERWVMSPVWIMKAGLAGSAPTLTIASLSVTSASGFTGLTWKPMWLSEICANVNDWPVAVAASALPRRRNVFGTPPETVHRMPVPAQVMHSSTWRRVEPSSLPLLFDATEVLHELFANVVTFVEWRGGASEKFPDHFYFRMRRHMFCFVLPTSLQVETCHFRRGDIDLARLCTRDLNLGS